MACLFVAVAPASAHGYISSPPSRQANCASGAVADCGDIVYEPQSVEAPKGSKLCNGGGTRFAALIDATKNWPATNVGPTVTYNWVITARHSTATWEYFIGDTLLASFDDAAGHGWNVGRGRRRHDRRPGHVRRPHLRLPAGAHRHRRVGAAERTGAVDARLLAGACAAAGRGEPHAPRPSDVDN